jgi:pimeloyl-ACP methyl ester carboxylesterase
LAEEALARGDADTAQLIFFRDIVGMTDAQVDRMRSPQWRAGWEYMMTILPRQMEDNRAIRALPFGVERYREIEVPALLLRGTESPKHLQDRLTALAAVLPHATIVDLLGEGHNANMSAPQLVADAIAAFAETLP